MLVAQDDGGAIVASSPVPVPYAPPPPYALDPAIAAAMAARNPRAPDPGPTGGGTPPTTPGPGGTVAVPMPTPGAGFQPPMIQGPFIPLGGIVADPAVRAALPEVIGGAAPLALGGGSTTLILPPAARLPGGVSPRVTHYDISLPGRGPREVVQVHDHAGIGGLGRLLGLGGLTGRKPPRHFADLFAA